MAPATRLDARRERSPSLACGCADDLAHRGAALAISARATPRAHGEARGRWRRRFARSPASSSTRSPRSSEAIVIGSRVGACRARQCRACLRAGVSSSTGRTRRASSVEDWPLFRATMRQHHPWRGDVLGQARSSSRLCAPRSASAGRARDFEGDGGGGMWNWKPARGRARGALAQRGDRHLRSCERVPATLRPDRARPPARRARRPRAGRAHEAASSSCAPSAHGAH